MNLAAAPVVYSVTGSTSKSDRLRNGGKFSKHPPCDGCGKPVTAHYSDDRVCGGGDGPGFNICDRARCGARLAKLEAAGGLEALRAHYTATRATVKPMNTAAQTRLREQAERLLVAARENVFTARFEISQAAVCAERQAPARTISDYFDRGIAALSRAAACRTEAKAVLAKARGLHREATSKEYAHLWLCSWQGFPLDRTGYARVVTAAGL